MYVERFPKRAHSRGEGPEAALQESLSVWDVKFLKISSFQDSSFAETLISRAPAIISDSTPQRLPAKRAHKACYLAALGRLGLTFQERRAGRSHLRGRGCGPPRPAPRRSCPHAEITAQAAGGGGPRRAARGGTGARPRPAAGRRQEWGVPGAERMEAGVRVRAGPGTPLGPPPETGTGLGVPLDAPCPALGLSRV